ncbi:MAG: ATP-binding protein [Opitutaceae bacterium]
MNPAEHPFIQSIADPTRRAAVIEEVNLVDFTDEECIFVEQSTPDALYLILEGSVAFTKERPDGSQQIMSISSEGSFFGEVGVFTGECRALGAQSKGTTRIGLIAESTVKRILEEADPIRLILESVVHHLNSTTTHYMDEVLSTEKLTLVGTMMSTILHDFKNPFSTISLAATLLRSKCADDPKAISLCENIQAQIDRMNTMANELSAYSRGDQQLNISHISLEDLFLHFRSLNAPFFENQKIQLDLHANNASLEADSDKLLRVLQNLIYNSIEAIRKEETFGIINVVATNMGDHILLNISDNGPGIPAEIQEDFFEPFVTHGKRGGTGLGTAIVKSIIDSHNGSISFDTGASGTTFTIKLPVKHTPKIS